MFKNQQYIQVLKKYDSNKIKLINSSKTINTLDSSDTVSKLDSSDTVSKLDSSDTVNKLDSSDTVSKLDSSDTVNKLDSSYIEYQKVLYTNEFLLNGFCRTCKLEDRSCHCLRYVDEPPEICYCGNKECAYDCGVLDCGCIDMCRIHRDY